jgi:predicted dinucleotide-utilizing enzyme
MLHLANKHRSRLNVPSGAIFGTDGLHSASAADIREVPLITMRAPRGLREHPD